MKYKQDAIKNYFPLPNEIFYLGLSAGEIAVYAYLMYCEDRKNFQCHPSYRTISRAVGLSRNTVKKYVFTLEEKRLIFTEPTTVCTKDGRKRNGSLLYTIRPKSITLISSYSVQRKNPHGIRRGSCLNSAGRKGRVRDENEIV